MKVKKNSKNRTIKHVIILIIDLHFASIYGLFGPVNSDRLFNKKHCLGSSREWGTPVPIPNTEVKPLFANDTYTISMGKVGRCQDSAF